LWPREPIYHLGLGDIRLRRWDLDGAETALRDATELVPDDPWIWASLGELYVRWSRLDRSHLADAEAAYREAVALAPNVADLHTALGMTLATQDRPDEALVHLEQAIALDAGSARAWEELAEIYETLGYEEDAAWAAEEAARWAVD
jgi:predicted Zn-dependent protease